MLRAYFDLNAQKDDADKAKKKAGLAACGLLYPEIPQKFVRDGREKKWKGRQHTHKGDRVISRMYAVDLADAER